MTEAAPRQPVAIPAATVFLVSAAVIGLELALMRCLAVASWHHFSYLVLSSALLGFGASGTLLTFAGAWLRERFATATFVLTLAFTLAVPLAFRLAQALPLEPRYVLYDGRQAALMIAYHAALFVPFLLAATVIGLALTHCARRVRTVYAANLVGSGAGGMGMLLLMYAIPAEGLLEAVSLTAALAAVVALAQVRRRRACGSACILAMVCLVVLRAASPLELRIDQYKPLAALRRLEAQGDARRVLTRHSPRGRIDLYESPRVHDTLFAGLTATAPPPPQFAVLVDGQSAGTVFDIDEAAEAAILDHTPMSVPYRLRRRPRVLLLGEAGGTSVWLARRWAAQHITVVHPDPHVVSLMRDSGLAGPDVTLVAADPRRFADADTGGRYDIIQLVLAEGMAAGASGLLSLHEDFLLTREGFAACLGRLRPDGLLAVTRGVQVPPRDNVKLLATAIEALESLGVDAPGEHVAQFRNYLAVTTLASPSPVDAATLDALRRVCGSDVLALDVEWPPELASSPPFAVVPGPPGSESSFYRWAAAELLSERREAYYAQWPFHVRPATDDSPYFHDSLRWRALPALRRAYGENWFRRTELGHLVVVAALGVAVAAGGVLILLPLAWRRVESGGRAPTLACFFALGLGFMVVEMTLTLKLVRLLGDPVLAVGGVVSAFMVFSGLGSAASARVAGGRRRAVLAGTIGAACFAAVAAAAPHGVLSFSDTWSTPARFALAVGLIAPVAFVMGWPFANALACLERAAPSLVPWAWGVNGFASVLAPPAAVLIAAGWGFRAGLLVGAGAYVACAVCARWLPGCGEPVTGRS